MLFFFFLKIVGYIEEKKGVEDKIIEKPLRSKIMAEVDVFVLFEKDVGLIFLILGSFL
jgi:hypothetical protein